jgi:uncharacterized protein YkwD
MEIAHWLAASISALSLLAQPVQPVSANEGFSEEVWLVSQLTNPVVAQVVAQDSRAASSTAAFERSVFRQINNYRKKKGLSLLSSNATITRQARQHSQDMADSRVLSHDGFNSRVDTIGESISYRSAAENVAYNMGYSAPDQQAVEGWIKSTGHRKNIEGNYNLTGIGVAKNARGEYYFTQIFIKR